MFIQKDQQELISVILPTYNRSRLLARAIRSVLSQTWSNLELIVVDDKSTDDTATVIGFFSDARLRYLKNDTLKKGANVARNIGLAHARGEYVAFQDSDDEWLCNKLDLQMKLFRTLGPEYACVYSRFVVKHKNRLIETVDTCRLRRGDILAELLNGNFITTQTSLIRKTCLTETGAFDEDLPRLQDWDLWLRMSRKFKFDFVDSALVVASIQPDSISQSSEKYAIALERLLQKYKSVFLVSNPNAFASHHVVLANTKLRQGIVDGVLPLYERAISIDSMNVKYRMLKHMYQHHVDLLVKFLKIKDSLKKHPLNDIRRHVKNRLKNLHSGRTG